jgi:hypothetical protein
MNNQMQSTLQKIPGIGDIPILGELFKSRAANKQQTELVVMITPQILPGDSDGVTNQLPRLAQPYLAPLPENKTRPNPPDAFTSDRRSSISVPVPDKAAEQERKLQEQAAQDERDRLADEARAAAKKEAAAQKLQAKQAEQDERAAAKSAEDAKRQAEEAARQAKADQKKQDKAAREQAKKDQEAAERAAKEAARQEKATKTKKADTEASNTAPVVDAVAIAEARARAAAIAADAKPLASN